MIGQERDREQQRDRERIYERSLEQERFSYRQRFGSDEDTLQRQRSEINRLQTRVVSLAQRLAEAESRQTKNPPVEIAVKSPDTEGRQFRHELYEEPTEIPETPDTEVTGPK
jgi:hypothetical protein